MKEYQLSDRTLVPAVGFGTYLADETAAALPLAVEVGYRYFDTAAYYFNEELVGKTLKNSGLKREEYQIASKVWHTELGYEKTKASFLASLKRLDCGYLDVFLIHWPRTKDGPEDWQTPLLGSWKALIDLQKQGLVQFHWGEQFPASSPSRVGRNRSGAGAGSVGMPSRLFAAVSGGLLQAERDLSPGLEPVGPGPGTARSPAPGNRRSTSHQHGSDLLGLFAAKRHDGAA